MGLRPATLNVQISALSDFLNRSLASNPWIVRFVKATMRMLPAKIDTTPPWDLSLVLNALTQDPFEPIGEIPIKYLTLKTAFLIAITTARRVGEMSPLVHSHPYT